MEILANVQDGTGARAAAQFPTQCAGLIRPELCFLSDLHEPSAAEQASIHGEVFAAFPGRKVLIRTLDAGSEKPVPLWCTLMSRIRHWAFVASG
ncbi:MULTISPECIES: putative PEP-binding protein [Arthrobacter]|uniref:putative PEP-binding protein n=1 Tax=Arthrobacter TaxID=1663 RepID=UPI001645FD1A